MSDEWTRIYEEYADSVFKFLMYVVNNREDAEDLTQETFVKAFQKWDQFDHRASLKTWILSIARNLSIDRLRKRQRISIISNLLRSEPTVVPELPEEVLNLSEKKQTLYQVIQSLRPNYRVVVILRGIQENSSAETAQILGWSVNKVNVTLNRAIRSLRTKLEGGDFPYELDPPGSAITE